MSITDSVMISHMLLIEAFSLLKVSDEFLLESNRIEVLDAHNVLLKCQTYYTAPNRLLIGNLRKYDLLQKVKES